MSSPYLELIWQQAKISLQKLWIPSDKYSSVKMMIRLNELFIISSDHSILVFRELLKQLISVSVGDVLYLDPGITKGDYFLGQIRNIMREDTYQKGMIIHLIPWCQIIPQ